MVVVRPAKYYETIGEVAESSRDPLCLLTALDYVLKSILDRSAVEKIKFKLNQRPNETTFSHGNSDSFMDIAGKLADGSGVFISSSISDLLRTH